MQLIVTGYVRIIVFLLYSQNQVKFQYLKLFSKIFIFFKFFKATTYFLLPSFPQTVMHPAFLFFLQMEQWHHLHYLPGFRLVDKSPSSEYLEPLSEPELPVLDSKTLTEITYTNEYKQI